MDNKGWDNPQAGRVYAGEGISPTLNTMQGGNRQPKILQKKYSVGAIRGRYSSDGKIEQQLEFNGTENVNALTTVQKDSVIVEDVQVLRPERTEYGKKVRKQYESGEIKESRHNMTELHPRKDGVSNTLTTVQKDNMVIESCSFISKKYEKFVSENGHFPKLFNPYNCSEIKDVAPTQTTQCGSTTSSSTVLKKNNYFRVRKLTPTECWILMGFTKEQIDKCIDIGVSNSQLYKQAGNSIITKCIELLGEHLYKAQIDNTYVCLDEKMSNFT